MNDDTYPLSEAHSAADGTQVTYQGRRLLGPSPRSSQSRRLPNSFDEQTLYIGLSPLLGEGLVAIVQAIPRTAALLCLEYEVPLQPLWLNGPVAVTESPAIRFATSIGEAVDYAVEMVGPRGVRRVEALSLSGAARLHHEEYRHTETLIQQYIHQYWKNRGTEVRLGRRWISNLWRNISMPSQSWDEIRKDPPRKAVVVGAGPSLDLHAHLLRSVIDSGDRGHGQRPLLIALDTALPSLAEREIPVDIVVAMDGQLVNTTDLVPFRWNHTILLADATVHPTVPRMFLPSRRFFFVTQFSDNSLFDRNTKDPDFEHKNALHMRSALQHAQRPVSFVPAPWMPVFPPRGSIAPTAVEVLSRCVGIEDIVTVGIDFYYRLPKSHATMSAPHRRFLRDHTRCTGADGTAGALFRPWRAGVLATGESTIVDGILEDQARQFRHLIEHLSRLGTQIRTLPGERIDIGTATIPETDFVAWWEEGATGPRRVPKRGATYKPDTGTHSNVASVKAAHDRLVAQETILADATRGAFLDSELSWAWFDLPQWPIAGRRRDWVELHRDRFLRGVRDHRRRIERTVLAAGAYRP